MTESERRMTRQRYREARDVKLVALAAGLYGEPMRDLEPDDNGLLHHTLRSGVKIVVSAAAQEQAPGLVNPATWQDRWQIKDRVWVADINGRELILKERKTNRHVDTKQGGHKDGLESAEEFDRALQFSALGMVEMGDGSMQAHWERPVGYVQFPDGFSFCVFEPEKRLAEAKPHADFQEHLRSVTAELQQAILQVPELYQEEFRTVQARANQIFADRPDILRNFDTGVPNPAGALTFDEFALLKARHVVSAVPGNLRRVMWGMGVVDGDEEGYYLHVLAGSASYKPRLDVSAFDYEYYFHDAAEASRQAREAEAIRESGKSIDSHFVTDYNDRTMMTAASCAFLEAEGWKLPEIYRTSRMVFKREADDERT